MRPQVRWGVVTASAMVLTLLAVRVRHAGPIGPDLPASEALQSLAPSLDPLMRVFSAAGSIPGVALLGGTVAVALLRRRRFRAAALVVATGSAEVVTLALRFATDRPRPSPQLVEVMVGGFGTSFPSGHAADAAALGVLIAQLVPPGDRRRRQVWIGVALFALASGISRIYLGAHWLTDVAGGYLVGAAIGLSLGGLLRRGVE